MSSLQYSKYFSAASLKVASEWVPSWVLLATLAGVFLTHSQYLLLRYSRYLGMGLLFYLLMSFIYLSQAIGTTASLKGFPAFLKNTNPLSLIEGQFATFFDGKGASGFAYILLFVGALLFSLANVFLKGKEGQVLEEKNEQ